MDQTSVRKSYADLLLINLVLFIISFIDVILQYNTKENIDMSEGT